jgi:hypothetical protein
MTDWNNNDECLLAVQQDGLNLQYVENQTEEIIFAAIQQNPYAIQFVQNQTDAMGLAAVRQNSEVLRLVTNQTDEIRLVAAQRYTEEINLLAVQHENAGIIFTDEWYLLSINTTGLPLTYEDNTQSSTYVLK